MLLGLIFIWLLMSSLHFWWVGTEFEQLDFSGPGFHLEV